MLWSSPALFWSTSPLHHLILILISCTTLIVMSQPTVTMFPDDYSSSSSSAIDVCLEPNRSPGAIQCPPPCSSTSNPNKNRNSTQQLQCLYYLKESHKEEVCGASDAADAATTASERVRVRNMLAEIRMRHCCEHVVEHALPDIGALLDTRQTCRDMLQQLIDIDRFIGRIVCGHARVLTRYDCTQVYSIVHRCEQCKDAYRRWVCSSLVPHYGYRRSSTKATTPDASTNGEEREERVRIRPCLNVCQDVEQQCPYLLPGDWTNLTLPPGENTAHPTPQYAGEPTFLCLDPNIPETGLQKAKSSRGDQDCCYTHCGSPGRGSNNKKTPESSSSSIRPWSGRSELLSVCEHCPGRPPNPSSSLSSSAASSKTFVTIDIVSLIITWTAWILYSNQPVLRRRHLVRNVLHDTFLIIITIIIMKCLLCATRSVVVVRMRTNQIWTKTLDYFENKCEGTCS